MTLEEKEQIIDKMHEKFGKCGCCGKINCYRRKSYQEKEPKLDKARSYKLSCIGFDEFFLIGEVNEKIALYEGAISEIIEQKDKEIMQLNNEIIKFGLDEGMYHNKIMGLKKEIEQLKDACKTCIRANNADNIYETNKKLNEEIKKLKQQQIKGFCKDCKRFSNFYECFSNKDNNKDDYCSYFENKE